MPRYNFRSRRLHVTAPLESGQRVALDAAQSNYLRNVLRLAPADRMLVFNGVDGEWRARLLEDGKRRVLLLIEEQTRAQTAAFDLHYLFAPIKHARLDYMMQKAVEMGACRLQPVITRYVQSARVNLDRLHANAIEAAEQCGILTVPEIGPPMSFGAMIAMREANRLLVFCDEAADVSDPVAALVGARDRAGGAVSSLAVLIGPEGGFAEDERAALLAQGNVVRIALGPRILRADTAAVAALALVGAVLGDWR